MRISSNYNLMNTTAVKSNYSTNIKTNKQELTQKPVSFGNSKITNYFLHRASNAELISRENVINLGKIKKALQELNGQTKAFMIKNNLQITNEAGTTETVNVLKNDGMIYIRKPNLKDGSEDTFAVLTMSEGNKNGKELFITFTNTKDSSKDLGINICKNQYGQYYFATKHKNIKPDAKTYNGLLNEWLPRTTKVIEELGK